MRATPALPARAAAAALLLLAGLAGCGEDERRTARNVLLITIDTLRADHVGSYGYPRDTTPNLDRLALEGTRFTRAVASSPWTVPSHASLFTGLDPLDHGAHSYEVTRPHPRNVHPLSERPPTLAAAFREAGFATGGIVANAGFLTKKLGLARGFETYDVRRRPGVERAARAIEWLDAQTGRRFFLFVNLLDSHRPYNTQPRPGLLPEPAPRDRNLAPTLFDLALAGDRIPDALHAQVVDQYDTGIAHADAAVGAILDHLRVTGRYDETLVVVTSDHGEYFGEHALGEHSKDVYQEALDVPLIVKRAGQTAARTDATRVSSADVPAMIVAALEPALRERLSPRFPARDPAGPVIAENYYSRARDLLNPVWGERFRRVRRAVFEGDHKLIHSSDGRHELYDLASDPAEASDLSARDPERRARMAAAVEARVAATRPQAGSREAAPPPAPEPTPAEMEELRALGYVD